MRFIPPVRHPNFYDEEGEGVLEETGQRSTFDELEVDPLIVAIDDSRRDGTSQTVLGSREKTTTHFGAKTPKTQTGKGGRG